ncbi:hypothetical protein [Polaribacter aquimarinus]|uniref:Uncharacterized protein n=1 Tax=Polaribacter aquimarinus TaxID=2100726 RepID=A0A2U2J788_9FLAO|nr:hypothetical protein [Polaribacter aquimarinus]PWG04198.1 hypothetical protein DIS07_14660 [Polaribacter aquimarinus]
MKSIVLFCLLFILISCKEEKKEVQNPSFLIGEWIRTNNKKESITYEFWKSDFTGLGYTLKNKDTAFKEVLSIVKINDTLHLEVKGVNENPTLFKFTNQTDTSFVCENPINEFPKKIKYILDRKQLKATVSSDDFVIDFVFDKLH